MEQIPDSLRSALAGRYDLERVIGQGGMATVYLARDARHSADTLREQLDPGHSTPARRQLPGRP